MRPRVQSCDAGTSAGRSAACRRQVSIPFNSPGSAFPDDSYRDEPDPRQVPSFRGPPPRLQGRLPAKAPPSPPLAQAFSDRGESPPILSASASRPKLPALRALVLVAGLSAGAALVGDRLVPADWRMPDPSQVFSELRRAVENPAGSARSDSAKMLDDKVEQPLEAGSATPAQEQPLGLAVSPELAALALARGDELMRLGDVASARRFYQLAATTGLQQAALAMARTYDRQYLQRLGARGLQGDAEKAARWYAKAAQLGGRDPR